MPQITPDNVKNSTPLNVQNDTRANAHLRKPVNFCIVRNQLVVARAGDARVEALSDLFDHQAPGG